MLIYSTEIKHHILWMKKKKYKLLYFKLPVKTLKT